MKIDPEGYGGHINLAGNRLRKLEFIFDHMDKWAEKGQWVTSLNLSKNRLE